MPFMMSRPSFSQSTLISVVIMALTIVGIVWISCGIAAINPCANMMTNCIPVTSMVGAAAMSPFSSCIIMLIPDCMIDGAFASSPAHRF